MMYDAAEFLTNDEESIVISQPSGRLSIATTLFC